MTEIGSGGFESDWFELVLTAGACRRAARAEPARAPAWEALAEHYSAQASVLMEWDAAGWRWPQLTEPG